MNNQFPNLLIILIILCTGCGAEKKSFEKIEDFTLTVEFEPAVFMTGRCMIEKNEQLNTMSLVLIYGNKYRLPPDWAKPIVSDPKTFTTNLPLFIYGDTIFVDSIETKKLEDEQIIKFIEDLPIDLGKQKDKNPNCISIDGYQIYFNYKTDSINNNFKFRSIEYDDMPESLILRSVIDLMNSNFESEIAKRYVNSWKMGFGFYNPPDNHDILPIIKINVP